jgi:2,4-dienoyl-CoA reductase-like NADH-dependent reductase (Old Yellow Enzyme family)
MTGIRAQEEPASLFDPLVLRGVTLPHRVSVSPMCMYASEDGFANDFHLVHLGRFALGGGGLIVMESTAIAPQGRISHHDVGIWSDEHIAPLRRVTEFITAHGGVPAVQLAHAGRKAAMRVPWRGGTPLEPNDAEAGYAPWPLVAPSAIPPTASWPVPAALDAAGIAASIRDWAAAARRAVQAGFRVIELHGGHGYLLHSFLSPLSNQRADEYGGDAERRARYPLEVVRAVREAIDDEVPLSYRVSAVDGAAGGLTIGDTVAFAVLLAENGVDLIDTSSGGISADRSVDTRVRRGYGYHAELSRAIRDAVDIPVSVVGLIVDAEQADRLIAGGDADVVRLGREMLDDPNWVLHARRRLDADEFSHWESRYGGFLELRAKGMATLAAEGETPLSRFGVDAVDPRP